MVLGEVVVFVDRGGLISACLPCPQLVVVIVVLSARALIPLTSRVDGRLLEVVAVGLLFFLPLSVDGELAAVEMSCIIKGNLTHDSLTRGTTITFTVDDAIQHLRQSSGQIQTEDSFAITFTSENLLLLGF